MLKNFIWWQKKKEKKTEAKAMTEHIPSKNILYTSNIL